MADEPPPFLRFVVPAEVVKGSRSAIGVIAVTYRLLREGGGEIPPATLDALAEHLEWIERHLAAPKRFTSTSSKGWYRRQARGLSWLRGTAVGHVAHLRALSALVHSTGREVAELAETRIGYIVYQDEQQVIAEPFRDTRVR
jgi:hypothetical protein